MITALIDTAHNVRSDLVELCILPTLLMNLHIELHMVDLLTDALIDILSLPERSIDVWLVLRKDLVNDVNLIDG